MAPLGTSWHLMSGQHHTFAYYSVQPSHPQLLVPVGSWGEGQGLALHPGRIMAPDGTYSTLNGRCSTIIKLGVLLEGYRTSSQSRLRAMEAAVVAANNSPLLPLQRIELVVHHFASQNELVARATSLLRDRLVLGLLGALSEPKPKTTPKCKTQGFVSSAGMAESTQPIRLSPPPA